MVGMGSSGPSRTTGPTRYRMSDHVAHMDALLEKLSIGEGKPKRPVYIAAHDWGSFIGFNYAMRFPGAVLGMAHMEGLVAPFTSWADFPVRGRKIFQAMRFDGGEEIVLTKNAFIERVVPASVTHGLSETEMNGYRYPFPTRESREPILQMVRQIPFSEDPEDVVAVIEKYAAFMKGSPMPKLFIDVKPGYFSGLIRKLTASWPNQVAVQVAGEHFAQEDSADEIGEAIADFVTTNSNL
jgi:haloalkane dehalogenase